VTKNTYIGKILSDIYNFVLPGSGSNPYSVPFEQPWNLESRRSMRGPAYEPLNTSNDAEDDVDQPQIRSVPSRPAIYYGEGPFSPPSSDDEDDYAKESDNDPNGTMRFEFGNGDDEEELFIGGRRHPVRWPFLATSIRPYLVLYSDLGLLNIF